MNDVIEPVVVPVAVSEDPAQPTTIKPPRIKSITLCDFRAFAGPEPVTIELGGKNLLVYGENGAGKSSIYHALDEFFALPHRDANASSRRARFSELRNKFSDLPITDAYVEVTFEGPSRTIRWDHAGHPIDTGTSSEAAVVRGAYRKAMLDYRSLLDTNYRHGGDQINLFDVCVQSILRDYPASYDGKDTTLFDIWQMLGVFLERGQLRKEQLAEIDALVLSFNTALRESVDLLQPHIQEILERLNWRDVIIKGFNAPGITYNRASWRDGRDFEEKRVNPEIAFREPELILQFPQTFLNEARLSALALAIYFAGRRVCANTLQADTPRIMVLDDVLIGLDQSNRLPVLDLLADEFRDWQIVLLTHDRVWFEMARAYHRQHQADKFWRYAKVHSNDDPTRAPTVTSVGSSAATETLADARSFLSTGHVNAAGNYARIAAELAFREFCEIKGIPVAYRQQPDKTPASELLDAAKAFSVSQCNRHYDKPLAAIEMYSTILLNQLSHGGVPTVTHHEVQGAINAVEALLFAVRVVPTGTRSPTR